VIRRLLVLAAAALVVGGCVGGSDGDQLDAYFDQVGVEQSAYREAQMGALQAMDMLAVRQPTASDCRRSSRLMGTARDDYGQLGGRLGKIEPPEPLRAAHLELTRSLRLYALYFDQLEQVIGFCDPVQLTAASLSTLPDRARKLRSDWRVKATRYAARTGVAFPAWANEVGRLQGATGSGTGV
jgi:hypothetical protein